MPAPRMGPGKIVETLTPVPCSSCLSASPSPRSPHLVAVYTDPFPGVATSPATEEMKTMCPARRLIMGPNAARELRGREEVDADGILQPGIAHVHKVVRDIHTGIGDEHIHRIGPSHQVAHFVELGEVSGKPHSGRTELADQSFELDLPSARDRDGTTPSREFMCNRATNASRGPRHQNSSRVESHA